MPTRLVSSFEGPAQAASSSKALAPPQRVAAGTDDGDDDGDNESEDNEPAVISEPDE
jgi:hypothetical protein